MDHREAKELLLEFVAGDLDRGTHKIVTSHVDNCDDCRSWTKTLNLLASATEVDPGCDHTSSELLALCAVRPEEINEPGRSDVHQHLENCPHCRREMELIRHAVLEARPEVEHPVIVKHSKRSHSWWRLAAAACFAAMALGWLAVEMTPSGHLDPKSNETVISTNEIAQNQPGSPDEEISGVEIEGTRLIEADGSLMLNKMRINNGAMVTIRAGDVVAFGNGFQIGPDTRVTVEVGVHKTVNDYRETKSRKEKSG